MNDLENRILFKYWAIYVDDIQIVCSGADRQIDRFLEEMKAMHMDIKFTEEKENKIITYLNSEEQYSRQQILLKTNPHRYNYPRRLFPPSKTRNGNYGKLLLQMNILTKNE